MKNLFTVETGISKQSAIFWYNSLTLLKPDIRPVGLPCANWQWKTSLGGSLRVSPFDELAAERRLLDEENDAGRLEDGTADELVLADDDVVVAVVSDVDGIMPFIGSSFLVWDFRFGGKSGIFDDQLTDFLFYTHTRNLEEIIRMIYWLLMYNNLKNTFI